MSFCNSFSQTKDTLNKEFKIDTTQFSTFNIKKFYLLPAYHSNQKRIFNKKLKNILYPTLGYRTDYIYYKNKYYPNNIAKKFLDTVKVTNFFIVKDSITKKTTLVINMPITKYKPH